MPFALNLLAPTQPRSLQPSLADDYDDGHSSSSSSSSTESNETATAPAPPRMNLQRASPTQPSSILAPPDFLRPHSANPSPAPSRSSSPLPLHYASAGASSSSYTSDADSEPTSPLLGLANARRASWWNDDTRRWWIMGNRPEDRRNRRRLRRESGFGIRTIKRQLRRLVRHPFFPRQPTAIVLTLLTFTVIAILVTLLLMHILNPDKASLPWRTYCSIPSPSTAPPSLTLSPTDDPVTVHVPIGFDPTLPSGPLISNSFPPPHLDDLPPAGVFLGVFTTDSAIERRMLIRSTWASQDRSRAGAGEGDGGNGTSRTIVRFVMGKARSDWERRIQLEAETYNDMIELPISENMNSGKTHAFFTWAANNARVPPPSVPSRIFAYSNISMSPPILAPHDPQSADSEHDWVRPDYVVKADDDSFVMLAELEARLRVELDDATRASATQHHIREVQDAHITYPAAHPWADLASGVDSHLASQALAEVWDSRGAVYSSAYAAPTGAAPRQFFANSPPSRTDPLIYWGYLVKNRFMAGELYALSWSLVNWVANEPTIKGMTRGAEDKQTAKWMRLHPRAEEVRWKAERCWIYDHPKAGTVYSHGFLFPSEATRVRRSVLSLLRPLKNLLVPSTPGLAPTATESTSDGGGKDGTVTFALPSPQLATTPSYSYSSVSQFGSHYTFPLSTLTPPQSIEALVEGSAMSGLFEGGPETAAQAWARREGRRKRYEGKRVGGTVVVHFIKRNEWFLETALALLGGEEVLEGEEGWKTEVSEGKTQKGSDSMARGRAGHQTMSKRRWR